MASVIFKNVKKIYPNTVSNTDMKKRRGRDESIPVEHNLQITEKGVVAVQEFSLDISDKEFIVLVGPSGCGKSTLLRMVAGLEEISEGEIWIGDKLVNSLPPKERDVAMVFQSYALFPHMTVYDNIAFALKMHKLPKDEIDRKVREAAEILDITDYLKRKPRALSGGQRQRVAIGRAIVCNPKVFLMDEPLSNLDAKLRNQMRTEIMKLRRSIDTTFIYVTHDQTEAMTLGDRIVIMKDGFIQQVGTPQEVFEHPKNLFVAGFIGLPPMNIFHGCRVVLSGGRYGVEVMGTVMPLPEEKQSAAAEQLLEGRAVAVGVRPVHMTVGKQGLRAKVAVSEMLGSELYIHLDMNGDEVIAVVPTMGDNISEFPAGTELYASWESRYMHVFDSESGENLL